MDDGILFRLNRQTNMSADWNTFGVCMCLIGHMSQYAEFRGKKLDPIRFVCLIVTIVMLGFERLAANMSDIMNVFSCLF